MLPHADSPLNLPWGNTGEYPWTRTRGCVLNPSQIKKGGSSKTLSCDATYIPQQFIQQNTRVGEQHHRPPLFCPPHTHFLIRIILLVILFELSQLSLPLDLNLMNRNSQLQHCHVSTPCTWWLKDRTLCQTLIELCWSAAGCGWSVTRTDGRQWRFNEKRFVVQFGFTQLYWKCGLGPVLLRGAAAE